MVATNMICLRFSVVLTKRLAIRILRRLSRSTLVLPEARAKGQVFGGGARRETSVPPYGIMTCTYIHTYIHTYFIRVYVWHFLLRILHDGW